MASELSREIAFAPLHVSGCSRRTSRSRQRSTKRAFMSSSSVTRGVMPKTVQEQICTVQVSEKILRHALGLAVLQPHGHQFPAHEPKGVRHGGVVLKALRKGYSMIPVLAVEDAENRLLQQLIDDWQRVCILVGL